jgi:hypothetical protein
MSYFQLAELTERRTLSVRRTNRIWSSISKPHMEYTKCMHFTIYSLLLSSVFFVKLSTGSISMHMCSRRRGKDKVDGMGKAKS